MNHDLELLFLKYKLALDVLKNKFNSLNLELSTMWDNNPIEHMKYRLKSIDSIEKKLKKKGLPLSSEIIKNNINDVVGVRVVCSFLNDMEKMIYIIKNDPQIRILKEKDYIQTPKESGYSSYHMIVEIPVLMFHKTEYVRSEIQIRTIAMDMWASLEHKIWYKKNIVLPDNMMEEISKTVYICDCIDKKLNSLIEYDNNPIKRLNPEVLSAISEKEYEAFMLKYQMALQYIENKIVALFYDYDRNGLINPIEHIKSRIKTKARIYQKLQKKNKEFNLENIQENINDIAGIRVVCSFQSDLEELIQKVTTIIGNDPNLEIVTVKDYVNNPKDSGYSSYHIIVQVPVHLVNGVVMAKVEIQLRTIAMDMWASLEHKLCYQKEVDPKLRKELKDLAGVIHIIDCNMNCIIEETRKIPLELTSAKERKKIMKLQK